MKKVFGTFVLFAALLTASAHAASDTVVIDASGSDGSYSGDDAARGGNIVLHLSYADAAKTVELLGPESARVIGRLVPRADGEPSRYIGG